MFWIKTIKKMQNIEAERYKLVQNRINRVSDYIQGPLAELIEKAVQNAIKQSNKKDK